jgi:hypothetical protein
VIIGAVSVADIQRLLKMFGDEGAYTAKEIFDVQKAEKPTHFRRPGERRVLDRHRRTIVLGARRIRCCLDSILTWPLLRPKP